MEIKIITSLKSEDIEIHIKTTRKELDEISKYGEKLDKLERLAKEKKDIAQNGFINDIERFLKHIDD